jgi:hypothetical protein
MEKMVQVIEKRMVPLSLVKERRDKLAQDLAAINEVIAKAEAVETPVVPPAVTPVVNETPTETVESVVEPVEPSA